MECRCVNEPLNTITASGAHFANTKVYIRKYENGCNFGHWPEVRNLLNKYTEWSIADNEILIIEKDYTGRSYPKTKQVARCGNAVPPAFSKALVQANLPELCRGVDISTMCEFHNLAAV